MPRFENSFKRLHLNMRTEQDVRWLPMDAWDEGGEEFDAEQLEGAVCYAGLDLSTTTDLSALSWVFPAGEGRGGYSVLLWFWVPEDGVRERSLRDKVPYDVWVKQGLIEATPGNVVDYDLIRKRINELKERFDIREICCDPWNATQLQTQLMGDGFTIIKFRQGFYSYAAPTKYFETLVLSRKLWHGGNPVLRWMASNVSVQQDSAGNIMPCKKKSAERIDGISSTIMAVGGASVSESPKASGYATREIAYV